MKLYHFPLVLAVLIILASIAGAAQAQTAVADPSGFVPLLNQARAARGLAPVAHDPSAAVVAAQNNNAQAAWGLGHHVLGGYGQVAAVGMADARAALDAWTGSPSHAALIYAPDLVAIGYHQFGGCCTASTRQGYPIAPAPAPVQPMTVFPVSYPQPVQCQWQYIPAQPVRWHWVR